MSLQIHNLKIKNMDDTDHDSSLQYSIFECEEQEKYYKVTKTVLGENHLRRIYKDKVGEFTYKEGGVGFSFEEVISVLMRDIEADVERRERFIEECMVYRRTAIHIGKQNLNLFKVKLFMSRLHKKIMNVIRGNNNKVIIHNLKQIAFDEKGKIIPGLQHSMYECEEYERYYRITDVIFGVDWFGNIGKDQIGVFTFGDGTFGFSLEEAIFAMVTSMDKETVRHMQFGSKGKAYIEEIRSFLVNNNHDNKPILCPLANRMISLYECLGITMAQEGEKSSNYIPEEFKVDGWREICGKCIYH